MGSSKTLNHSLAGRPSKQKNPQQKQQEVKSPLLPQENHFVPKGGQEALRKEWGEAENNGGVLERYSRVSHGKGLSLTKPSLTGKQPEVSELLADPQGSPNLAPTPEAKANTRPAGPGPLGWPHRVGLCGLTGLVNPPRELGTHPGRPEPPFPATWNPRRQVTEDQRAARKSSPTHLALFRPPGKSLAQAGPLEPGSPEPRVTLLGIKERRDRPGSAAVSPHRHSGFHQPSFLGKLLHGHTSVAGGSPGAGCELGAPGVGAPWRTGVHP